MFSFEIDSTADFVVALCSADVVENLSYCLCERGLCFHCGQIDTHDQCRNKDDIEVIEGIALVTFAARAAVSRQ